MLAEIIHKLEDEFIEINVKIKTKNVEGKLSKASIHYTIKYGRRETLRKQGEKGERVKSLVDGMADRQFRAKRRCSAGLLGRRAAAASV